MNVQATRPEVDAGALLPGAQFMDAYSVAVDGAAFNARRAAEKVLSRGPRWGDALVALRDRLVRPFGLKTASHAKTISTDTIGIFPVISETPDRLVVGFDDTHLDFRVVLDVATSSNSQRVSLTTLVLTHNLLGRTYLAIILPFHRLIARAKLQQVAD
jgi:Protein of unknown function (DUF2867)